MQSPVKEARSLLCYWWNRGTPLQMVDALLQLTFHLPVSMWLGLWEGRHIPMSTTSLHARLSPVSPFFNWLKMTQSQLTPSHLPPFSALTSHIMILYNIQPVVQLFTPRKLLSNVWKHIQITELPVVAGRMSVMYLAICEYYVTCYVVIITYFLFFLMRHHCANMTTLFLTHCTS